MKILVDYFRIAKDLIDGDLVQWQSRNSNIKEGIFRGIIPSNQNPETALPWLKDISTSRIKFGHGRNTISGNTRLVIEVERFKKWNRAEKITSHFFGISILSILQVNGTPVSKIKHC